MTEKTVYPGKIVEVVEIEQSDGRIFELARRAPGTRLIIPSQDGEQLLLTREHRREVEGYDYRLPGGKVFDRLEDYNNFLSTSADILEPATEQAKTEAVQEAGITVQALKHVHTSVCGATMEWDLYYFLVTDWEKHEAGQALEEGEDIEVVWHSREDVRKMLLDGSINEDRSAAVIWRWLEGKL